MFTNYSTVSHLNSMEQSPREANDLQLVKKFLALYGTRRIITVFTKPTNRSYPEPYDVF
jgi:hypothetical protein